MTVLFSSTVLVFLTAIDVIKTYNGLLYSFISVFYNLDSQV